MVIDYEYLRRCSSANRRYRKAANLTRVLSIQAAGVTNRQRHVGAPDSQNRCRQALPDE